MRMTLLALLLTLAAVAAHARPVERWKGTLVDVYTGRTVPLRLRIADAVTWPAGTGLCSNRRAPEPCVVGEALCAGCRVAAPFDAGEFRAVTGAVRCGRRSFDCHRRRGELLGVVSGSAAWFWIAFRGDVACRLVGPLGADGLVIGRTECNSGEGTFELRRVR